jgi:predicted NAD/FAD-binding protein
LRPAFYRLLSEITRFFKVANRTLTTNDAQGLSVRQYAARHGFGPDLLNYYLVPMSSAVWSTHPDEVLDFPAEMLIRFFFNHGFLGVKTHHPWFTVSRGSRSYLRKILTQTAEPRLNSKVVCVEEVADGVRVRTADGSDSIFDRVIVATHADEALSLLGRPDASQERLLKPWRYQHNAATLHTDATCMPKRKIAWASWNYRIEQTPESKLRATTHYWMNALQKVSETKNYFVSINARGLIEPSAVLYETDYDHPTFTVDSIATQSELASLNTRNAGQRIYFCGSYFRYGFHEDAYWSAVELSRVVRDHIALR